AAPDCSTATDVTRFTVSGTHTYANPGTYAILVQATGVGNFNASALISALPPANDNWANAALASGSSGSASGENDGATIEQGEPLQLTAATTGKTVWWKWVAPATGGFTFDTAGSSFDTVLGVFTGSSVSNLTPVASDDDSGGNGTSRASFGASAGTTYYVQVGSYAGGATG